MAETGCLKDGHFQNLDVEGRIHGVSTTKKSVNTSFNSVAGETGTLTAEQSGTLFLIEGTGNNVITLPAPSANNVGVYYEFFLSVAVGGGTATTIVTGGSGSNDFSGKLTLAAGVAANPVVGASGHTLKLVSSTVAGARVSVTCVVDTGTDSTWMADAFGTPLPTSTG